LNYYQNKDSVKILAKSLLKRKIEIIPKITKKKKSSNTDSKGKRTNFEAQNDAHGA